MKALTAVLTSFLFLLLLNSNEVDSARGGGGGGGGSRGGGGGFRGGGSRFSGGGSRSSFRTSGARPWNSGTSGTFAFILMANIAARRPLYPGSKVNYRNQTSGSYGSYCTNLHSFNGTVFGTFRCPIDGFSSAQKYCCGPNQFEYCCKFFDSTGRTVGIVFAVLAFVGVCIVTIVCSVAIYKRRCQKPLYERATAHPTANKPKTNNIIKPQKQTNIHYQPNTTNNINTQTLNVKNLNPIQQNNGRSDNPPPYPQSVKPNNVII